LTNKLKEILEKNYSDYKKQFSSKDPVWNLHKYNKSEDIEIAGFITSCYTYGQVDNIINFTEKLFLRTGNKPYEFTINFQKHKDKKFLKGLNYRFNTETDIINLFEKLKEIIIKNGSLKNLFLINYCKNDENIINGLKSFTKCFVLKSSKNTGFYNKLIPDPEKNSACKRLNLFLRWMVRKDEIDLGIWKEIDKSKLIMPVDVHIARISKKLKLINRKSADLKFAVELTNELKKYDRDDPVKYDFSLCHLGIDNKII
jgi:uncharacterized protein (TIGR02757 family)